ncbi:MAG TPA: phosphatidylserine decarboxylase family protein [bacterium]|nr:phosphatidylserine decarboxylase family protein [bacterium]HOL46734.1 phosphatidylserine decarboxylase family protein [bacterium]HPQ18170.1 phosphatidylserine decarboxylase family protein [bacterium]
MKRNFPILEEGWYYIIPSFILMLIFWYISDVNGTLFSKLIFFVSIIYFALVLNFFRDPERNINLKNRKLIVSPADGTITKIEYNIEEKEYRKEPSIRVSIFMSVTDVHIQRMPIDGVIEYMNYKKGEFKSVLNEDAQLNNEKLLTGIKTENNEKITVVQIAGLIARRIVSLLKINDKVKQGERIGYIRFGSRVDIYLPQNTKLFVIEGQEVKGNLTIIGRLG